MFSVASLDKLETCHPDLQAVALAVEVLMDFSVLCGHRDEAEQNHDFAIGASKKKWPDSRHNSSPAEAMDIAPYPVNWDNLSAFRELARLMFQEAAKLGVEIEWGGHWDSFPDLSHFQLAKRSTKA